MSEKQTNDITYNLDIEDIPNNQNASIVQLVKVVLCEDPEDEICPVLEIGIKALTPTMAANYIKDNADDFKFKIHDLAFRTYGKRYRIKHISIEV